MEIEGVNIVAKQWSAILDSVTCDICEELDGQIADINDPGMPDPPVHDFCLSAGHKVLIMEKKTHRAKRKNIEDIKVGDRVYTHKKRFRLVVDTFKRYYKGEMIEIETYEGNKIQLTPNHSVLTNRGWIRADELRENDKLSYCQFNQSKRMLLRIEERIEKQSKKAINGLLQTLYWEKKKTTREICQLLKTNFRTLRKIMIKYDIKMRRGSEATKMQYIRNPKRKEMAKEIARKTFRKYFDTHSPWCKGLTKETSERLKSNSIKHLGEKNGMFGRLGQAHPNWNGGASFEPYTPEFNKQLKEQIKKRDNYTCQKCGSQEDLSVHHIDYNKKNCKKENLITLCIRCNSKVNYQRGFWMGYFMGEMGIKATYKQIDLF